jgi:hypothetical protein
MSDYVSFCFRCRRCRRAEHFAAPDFIHAWGYASAEGWQTVPTPRGREIACGKCRSQTAIDAATSVHR